MSNCNNTNNYRMCHQLAIDDPGGLKSYLANEFRHLISIAC